MFKGKGEYNSAVARDANSKYRYNNNNKRAYVNNNNSSNYNTNKDNNNAFRTHNNNNNRYTIKNNVKDKSVNKADNDDDDDDDDNAPPVALSARTTTNTITNEQEELQYSHKESRRSNDKNNNYQRRSSTRDASSSAQWPHQAQRSNSHDKSFGMPRHDKPQANKRLREHSSSSTQASASEFPNTHSDNVQMTNTPQTKASTTKMLTVLNEKETELPQKLNTKVFVDGLPYRYDPEPGQPSLEDELAQFVSAWKVGKVIRLIKKPGHGFGFLVFKSPNSVPVAIKVLHGRKFFGRPLRVALPKPRDLEAMNDVAGMKDIGKTSFKRQVLLSDLPKVCQPEIVREVLRDVAPQLESKLETIKMTSRNRKAFLTFASEAEIPSAIQFLNGFHLLGRKIVAVAAAPPGSLPYSHTQQLASANIAATGNTNANNNNLTNTSESTQHRESIKQSDLLASNTQNSNNTHAQKLPDSNNNKNNIASNKNGLLNKDAEEYVQGDDNEVAIVPLGAEVSTMRKSRQGNALQRSTDAANEKKGLQGQEQLEVQKQAIGTNRTDNNTLNDALPQTAHKNRTMHVPANARSNVTGQTDKYNLLDNGPAEMYVGNLNENVTVNDLRVHFASCGKINHIELLAHSETHLPLGIARITFAIPAYAAYAVSKLHGSRLHDCVIRVDRGEESSAPLSHERQSKLDSLLEHAAHVANTKAPIDINAMEKQNGNDSDEEEIDEVGFMAHHGIHNPEEYFKDTSVGFASIGKESNRKQSIHTTERQDTKVKQKKKTNASKSKDDSITVKKRLPEETKTLAELKRQRSNSANNNSKNDEECNLHERKKLQKVDKNNKDKNFNNATTASAISKGVHGSIILKNKKQKGNVVKIDDDDKDDNQEDDDDNGDDYDKVALTGMLASDSESEEEHFVDADMITPERLHEKKPLSLAKAKGNKHSSKKEIHVNVKKSTLIQKRKQSSVDKVIKM